jgi:hypothetical protein
MCNETLCRLSDKLDNGTAVYYHIDNAHLSDYGNMLFFDDLMEAIFGP